MSSIRQSLPTPVARFVKSGPSNACGVAILTATAAVAAVAESQARQVDWIAVLRAWWVDPAVATLGFASAILFFDHRERREGCGVRSSWGVSHIALVYYWLFVYGWRQVIPPLSHIPDGLPTDVSSAAYLALEVAYGLFAYDLIFFFVHWSMHAAQLEFRHEHHCFTTRR